MAERLDKQRERREREERYNTPLPPELEVLRWKLMFDIHHELQELHKQLVSDVVERFDRLLRCEFCGAIFSPHEPSYGNLSKLLQYVPSVRVQCPACKTEDVFSVVSPVCQNCGYVVLQEQDK